MIGALLSLTAPTRVSAASYSVNVSQTGADTYRVNSGDLPAGTTILTQSCGDFAGAVDAVVSWFGPGSNLDQMLFSTGTFCPITSITPQPTLSTPTPLPPFDD